MAETKDVSKMARELGRLGGLKGGKARAEALSPAERSEQSSRAGQARWDKEKSIPRAMYEGELNIGGITMECAVLEDGTRVLNQASFLQAIGRSRSPKAGTGVTVAEIPTFLAAKNLEPYLDQDFVMSTKPIQYRDTSGRLANGYNAEILPNTCEVYLKARDNLALSHTQKHIAKRCEILIRGLANVGIIALVDEATGYQDFRSKRALEEILERFIAKELRKWARAFPNDFYKQLFRLRGWQYSPLSVKRPSLVGKLTNNLVYERLAPYVLEELKTRNPTDERGRRKHKHHQWLTEDIGHPKLLEHLSAVIALMKASDNWKDFYKGVNRALPKYEPMPLFEQAEARTAIGITRS